MSARSRHEPWFRAREPYKREMEWAMACLEKHTGMVIWGNFDRVEFTDAHGERSSLLVNREGGA